MAGAELSNTDRPGVGGPAPAAALVDLYFMEHRAKVLDIAAFLDRLDRAQGEDGGGDDSRVAALRRAIAVLGQPGPGRAKRVLELLSDGSADPIGSAAGVGPARGAPPPPSEPR